MATPQMSVRLMQEAVDLVARYGNVSSAARAAGIPDNTLRMRYARGVAQGLKVLPLSAIPEGFEVKKISTSTDADGVTLKQHIQSRPQGFVDETVPDGHLVKGYSTLLDESGKVRAQWVKTTLDAEKWREKIDGACAAAAKAVKPLKRVAAPKRCKADLLNLYVITDYHMGMLAWARETGAPWDLEIGERVLMDVLGAMLDAAPDAEVGILENLGDFLHFDSLKALTPEHGHLLDADSRYQKVVEVTVRVLIWCVHRMLEKHAKVHVDMREGNHDPAGSIWLRVLFAQIFKNNPRVTVEQSPRPYVIYPWGQTLLGFHHGHLSKNGNLPQLFAALFRVEWGQATHTYIHTGHKHHIDEKEHPGANVLQHPTLAAPDAYAARGGWLSKRQALSITYHKTAGEIGRRMHLPPE